MNSILQTCSKCFITNTELWYSNLLNELLCDSCKLNEANVLDDSFKQNLKEDTSNNTKAAEHFNVNPYLQMLNLTFEGIPEVQDTRSSLSEKGNERDEHHILMILSTPSEHAYDQSVSISGYSMDNDQLHGYNSLADISRSLEFIAQFNEGKEPNHPLVIGNVSEVLDEKPIVKPFKVSRQTPKYQKDMLIKCSNCMRTHSYTWYHVKTPYTKCATCYQYEHKHDGKPRPIRSKSNTKYKQTKTKSRTRPKYKTARLTDVKTEAISSKKPISAIDLHSTHAKYVEADFIGRQPTLADLGEDLFSLQSLKHCDNCKTQQTPMWHRTEDRQNYLCSACYQYKRNHNQDRPDDLFRFPSALDSRETRSGSPMSSLSDTNLESVVNNL